MLSVAATRVAAAVGVLSGFVFASSAAAIPIDLNSFYFEPLAPVTVSADGSSATLGESADFGVVYLSNIPGLGDPEVITGGAGVSLVFDYLFDEPLGNADVFHVALLDGLSGDVIGGAFESFLSASGAGQLSFDLSALVGMTLGLQFELVPELLDGGLSSSLTLSNLQLLLDQTPPTSIPEPQPLLLLLAGFALLFAIRLFGSKVSTNTQT
jgi:hypothetical protein